MDTQRCVSKAERRVTSLMLSDELKADLPRLIHHEQDLLDQWNGRPRISQRPQRAKHWLIRIWGRRTPNFPAKRSQMSISQSIIKDKRPWKNACAQAKRKLKKICKTNEGWFEILTHLKDSREERWCWLRLAAREQSHSMEPIES